MQWDKTSQLSEIALTVKIENVPSYANDHKFIVARLVDGVLWFWGAYDDEDLANEVVEDVNGLVVLNERI